MSERNSKQAPYRSEVLDGEVEAVVERRDREDVQARMDRTMELWNDFNRDTLSVTDEFSELCS